ncbi:hypothetical protein [Polaribacter atrinae]|uniref:hypothetical protein n=1 Tax=Polaribacter atrinae TaxID=1333662 RepID=UPI00248F8059|nr:hypothetical protein [Polaribacter atrinae]
MLEIIKENKKTIDHIYFGYVALLFTGDVYEIIVGSIYSYTKLKEGSLNPNKFGVFY